jgi:hypothetical protein
MADLDKLPHIAIELTFNTNLLPDWARSKKADEPLDLEAPSAKALSQMRTREHYLDLPATALRADDPAGQAAARLSLEATSCQELMSKGQGSSLLKNCLLSTDKH